MVVVASKQSRESSRIWILDLYYSSRRKYTYHHFATTTYHFVTLKSGGGGGKKAAAALTIAFILPRLLLLFYNNKQIVVGETDGRKMVQLRPYFTPTICLEVAIKFSTMLRSTFLELKPFGRKEEKYVVIQPVRDACRVDKHFNRRITDNSIIWSCKNQNPIDFERWIKFSS